jgi:hypothetical protein
MTESATKPVLFIATPCFGGLVSQHYMLKAIFLFLPISFNSVRVYNPLNHNA